MFSIIIPTWNNLSFVELCVRSIKQNSHFEHEIILHINDGSDGTLKWAEENGIVFTHSAENSGICRAVNLAASLSTTEYIVYMNDDMYVCPNWDLELKNAIDAIGHQSFMLSSTMIEPNDTSNQCVIVHDFGKTIENFKEFDLLAAFSGLNKSDWNGSAWPPTIVHKSMWALTGGYSIEFSPGMSSDDDFAMKMWLAGCRIFKGIGASKVYHFQSKSTLRIKKNNGRKQFMNKYQISQSTFNKQVIRRGTPYTAPFKDVDFGSFIFDRIKVRIKKIFG